LLLAASGEWDQSLDTAQRALDQDDGNLDALKIITLHAFTQESHLDEAQNKFEHLVETLLQREAYAPALYHSTSRLFSRICSRQLRSLQLCQKLMEHVLNQDSIDSEGIYHCEMGYLCTLLGQFSLAMRSYSDASKRSSNSFLALEGMILCQLYEGKLDDAEAQIELLSVMRETTEDHEDSTGGAAGGGSSGGGGGGGGGGNSPEFAYIESLLALKKKRDMKLHLQKLDECQRLYFQRCLNVMKRNSTADPLLEYVVMNPDFLLEV
jgi:tetratricopeptide (TPR) repeat protein